MAPTARPCQPERHPPSPSSPRAVRRPALRLVLGLSVDVPQPAPDVVPLPPSPHPVPPSPATPPEVKEPPMPGQAPVIDPVAPSMHRPRRGADRTDPATTSSPTRR